MNTTILGKKVGMTQIFTEEGKKVAVTVLDVSNVVVSRLEKQGDQVTHVELGKDAQKNPNKPMQGKYKATKLVPSFRYTVKVQQQDSETPEVGTQISANIFAEGDKVKVIGTTKGKGFQGVMKRWGFRGGPRTHGGPTGKMRAPGSVGSGTTPGNVIKGKKMPGHMGNVQQTVQNLHIAKVDMDNGLIAVAGAIPGSNGSYVVISKSTRNK